MTAPSTGLATFSCCRCQHVSERFEPAFVLDENVVCHRCNDEARRECPQCHGAVGQSLPARRGKCKQCGQAFFVVPKQWLFNTMVLTEAQKATAESLTARINRWMKQGFPLDFIEHSIFRHRSTGVWSEPDLAADIHDAVYANLRLLLGDSTPEQDLRAVIADQDRKLTGQFRQFKTLPSIFDITWGVLITAGMSCGRASDFESGNFMKQAAHRYLVSVGRNASHVSFHPSTLTGLTINVSRV